MIYFFSIFFLTVFIWLLINKSKKEIDVNMLNKNIFKVTYTYKGKEFIEYMLADTKNKNKIYMLAREKFYHNKFNLKVELVGTFLDYLKDDGELIFHT